MFLVSLLNIQCHLLLLGMILKQLREEYLYGMFLKEHHIGNIFGKCMIKFKLEVFILRLYLNLLILWLVLFHIHMFMLLIELELFLKKVFHIKK